ncbi:hypothetical protein MKW92_033455 [Papaver armeniacum]|nr:hypothetical protein MKW92_033455 [Papaver armeniacum]
MNINISFHLILLVGTIIAINLIEVALTLDHRFEDCKPKHCGNGLNISYPFWIKENYCGFRGFKVTCRNSEPILHVAGYNYTIRDIHYEKRLFRVENSITYGACPVPFRNSTFNDHTPFRTGSEVHALSFFYNCTNFTHKLYDKFVYPVNASCVTISRHHPFSFAGFVPPGKSAYDNIRCQLSVNVPVEVEPSVEPEGQGQVNGYLPLFKKGFTLHWNKSPCKDCQASGGYCGVDEKGLVVCFCKDGPYHKKCGIVFFNCYVHNFMPSFFLLITF